MNSLDLTSLTNFFSLADASREQVHIWTVSLDHFFTDVDTFILLLSDDELKRANNFIVKDARIRYIIARAILRMLLSRYLGIDSKRIIFRYNSYGKPSLSCPSLIQFNISHSNTQMLVAICYKKSIGIDIEQINNNLDFAEIAVSLMSSNERDQFVKLPPDSQRNAFFRWWTRKEAYVKGKGAGLLMALDSFDVDIDEYGKNILLYDWNEPSAPLRWSIHNLDVKQNYVAALAIGSVDCEIKQLDYCEYYYR